MSIDVKILSGDHTRTADVVETEYGENALVVATIPMYYNHPVRKHFASDNYGINLNIPLSYGDTPEEVYDGGDNTYWTLSGISGTAPTNSTARFYSGASSLLWNGPTQGSVFQLAKGSNIDLTNYIAITFKIQVDKNYKPALNQIEIYGYNTTTGTEVGTRIHLEDYITPDNYDVWQSVIIPLNDMNLINQTINALRFQITVADKKEPVIYIDDLQIEEKSSEIGIFKVEPDKQTHLYIDAIRLYFVDVYDSTLLNASMWNFPFDTFLGEGELASGITLGLFRREEPIDTAIVRNFGDILKLADTHINGLGCDGTNTFVTIDINFPIPLELKSVSNESYRIIIREDLSGLTIFKATASGYYRTVEGLQ